LTDALQRHYRELAFRANDGLEVRLLWNAREDRLVVAVSDEHSGEHFVLDAASDKALETFYHPFAHAGLPEAA
jgi:hypothetical protein